MKILRQVQLFFQDGSSDKVYEVDLCEVSPGACVVNFRFGRRGTPLRDGTKTTLSVDLAKAQKIFDALVAEKRGKGYREAGEAAAAGPKPPRGAAARDPGEAQRRAEAIVLRRFDARLKDHDLDRLIWRSGERRLAAAVPRLLELLPKATGRLRRYSLAWALGRIGAVEALPALEALSRDADPPTSAIAAHARLLLLEPAERLAEAQRRRLGWPAEVVAALGEWPAGATLTPPLAAWAESTRWTCLQELYLADALPAARQALLTLAAAAPMAAPAFRCLRRLFKAAELRCDGELFALLARRLEKEQAAFRRSPWDDHIYLGGKRVKIADELKRDDSRLGYSEKTRTYLRLRAGRALRKLGELGDPAYVPMAVSLLLTYFDEDAGVARSYSVMNWETERRTTIYVDPWLNYWSFCFVLYRHSPRYEPKKKGGWRCQPNYRPGKAPPMVREEAFPQLWDGVPEALLYLIEVSRCAPVHEFAAKALGQNKAFCAELPIAKLAMMLARPYEPSWQLGLRLAGERWQAKPEIELLLALLGSRGEPARARGLALLGEAPAYFADARVVLALLLSPYGETRRVLFDRWRQAPPAATLASGPLLEEVLRGLLRLAPSDENAAERAADAAAAILVGFTVALRDLPGELLAELLGHPLVEIQQLGGRIVAEFFPVERLSGDLLARLLAADSPAVRAQGVVVLGRLPLATMDGAEEALLAFCVAKESEIRQAARLPLRSLQKDAPAAAGRLATALAARLLRADRPAGLHADLQPMLLEDLAPSLPGLGREMALRLLAARYPAAQAIGCRVIDLMNAWPGLALRELARLAQHEMAEVRDKAWLTLEAEVERVRQAPTELIPAIDGSWADSRERGQRYFSERFSGSDFDPLLLVALCDAVTPAARAFGREMLRRHFDGAQAETYLLRLAQHPSADVQLFASGLLETHARDRPSLLEQLLPFCARVLGRVYQGRAAKVRVLAFLHREAVASEAAARLVLPLLETVSASIAVADRAAALLALRDIQQAFPQLAGPLRRRDAELRVG